MAKKPSPVAGAMKYLKDNDIKYVDLRFTDPRGKMQHVTQDISTIDEDVWADGLMFDGSSIAGWKAINESDMVLMLDPESLHIDPFYAQKTAAVFCDILEPGSGEAYERDPRTTAKKAEAYVKSTGIGDSRSRLDRRPSSSCSTMCALQLIPTIPASGWTPRNCRPTWMPSTKWAIWATVRGPRADISR